MAATTNSFASSWEHNPFNREGIYDGATQDIIKLDYCCYFIIVLLICAWFHNIKDEYGLSCVYFNKSCSMFYLFILVSKVHQVFYTEYPTEIDVYFAKNKVSINLYDLEE